jgi:hypothetical protein
MHPSLRSLAVLIFAFTFSASAGISIIRAAFHSWDLPMCWRCGAGKVHRSTSYSIIDFLVKFLFLVPYRCRGCLSRFYGLRSGRLLPEPHS